MKNKFQERISDLFQQGINLAIEVEKIKRKLRRYIEMVDELEKEIMVKNK